MSICSLLACNFCAFVNLKNEVKHVYRVVGFWNCLEGFLHTVYSIFKYSTLPSKSLALDLLPEDFC